MDGWPALFMKISAGSFHLIGKLLRDTDQYRLVDKELQRLIVSETNLKPNKATNGHKHDGVEEIYIFVAGSGDIQIDEFKQPVMSGDIFAIPDGAFHKVFAGKLGLRFISVFEKYER